MMHALLRSVRGPLAAALLALAITAAPPARADVVELGASRDGTLIIHPDGELANGLGGGIFCGRTNQPASQATRRAVLHFDVAGAIPAGATITAATLRLRVTDAATSAPQTCTLHRMLVDWGEGASDADGIGGGGTGVPSQPGDATWIHAFYPDVPWATPGGDYASTPSAATPVGGAGVFYEWGPSGGIVDDVQAWLDDPSSQHGWILLGNESSPGTARRFTSKDGPVESLRPRLTVWYELNEPVPGDVDGDGDADFEDVLALLADWGATCPPDCAADLDGSGDVGFADLLIVLGNWS